MEFCTGFLFSREYSRRRPGPFPLFHAREREFDAREREFSRFTPLLYPIDFIDVFDILDEPPEAQTSDGSNLQNEDKP
jgi:hypothetical protein